MSCSYLTADHHDLRLAVRKFAEEEVAPRVARMEEERTVEHELVNLIAEQGWIGVTVPRKYGGMDAGHLAKTLIIEELSRISAAIGAAGQASQLGSAGIIHLGTDEQKETWLPQIASGSCLPTIAVTEPESGGHVLGMTSTARRVGDEYEITGCKVYVGNSHVANLHCVVVRTGEPTDSRGLSAFLVESDRPGLSLAPHRPYMGLHGFSFGKLVFDRCRVPASNMIGQEGDGLRVAYLSSVTYGRPNLTAVSLGIQQATQELTTQYVQQRQTKWGKLADMPTIKQKLALITSRLMTTRTIAYNAVHNLDKLTRHGEEPAGSAAQLLNQGIRYDEELMNAKYQTVEAALDSTRAAAEIHGAKALTTDYPLERHIRDAFHIYSPAGTGDIQLLRLAESALGRSKGQWSQLLLEKAA